VTVDPVVSCFGETVLIRVDTHRPSVLVVDDNPLIVNVVKSLLESVDYEVHSSANGKEAFDYLAKQSVDLIICDVMMPEMDGYTLHNMLQKNIDHAHVPFIFLTALGEEREVNRGRETGADDYMIKPFDPKHLLSVVKGKIARSRSLKNLSEKRQDTYRKKVIQTLSHEFRTPLVAINTGTEVLLQHNKVDTANVKKLLEAVHRGGKRLESLVNDFMILQQVEGGVAAKSFGNHAANHKVSDILSCFMESVVEDTETESSQIKLLDDSREATCYVYEPQILDILKKLVGNAAKFGQISSSEFKNEVEIATYRDNHHVIIDVKDRGMGINVERLQEALIAFGQVDRDKLEQQGSGLGLAIASRYAEINGGRLEFKKREGGGSIVSLVLPISE